MKIKILVMMLACAYVFAQQRDQKSEFANDAVQTTIANANVSTDAALKIPQTKPASKKSGEPQEYADLKVMPSPKTPIMPVYPQVAKLAGIQGKVYVEATIDEKGNVIETKILKSDHETLEPAALEAVKNTKFNPGVSKSNKKTKAKVVVPMMFKLEGSDAKKAESKKDAQAVQSTSTKEDDVDPDMNTFVEFEKAPEMLNAEKPKYPAEAKAKKITGKVFVKLLINKEGTPKKAVVIKSDSELLNQPAVDAALKSKFSPALQKGKPMSVWIVLPYKFTLPGIEEIYKPHLVEYKTIEEAKAGFEKIKNIKEMTKELNGGKQIKVTVETIKIEENFGDESVLRLFKDPKGDFYWFSARIANKIYEFQSEKLDKLIDYIKQYKNKASDDVPQVLQFEVTLKEGYPEEAILKKIEGEVLLGVEWSEEGKVKSAKLINWADPILHNHAFEFVKNITSAYGRIENGKKKEGPEKISIIYKLK